MLGRNATLGRIAPLLIALALTIGGPAEAQESPGAQTGSSTKVISTTELVLVPVVVRDKAGAPITGLSQSDFEVFEAGKRQKISIFEEVKTPASPARRAPAKTGVYSNRIEGDASHKPIVVIALDEINSPYLDQVRARKDLLARLADAIGDGALTALIRMDAGGVTVVHDFTADPRILQAELRGVAARVSSTELDKVRPELAPQSSMFDSDASVALLSPTELKLSFEEKLLARAPKTASHAAAVEVTLECLQHIAHGLAGIPGRKSLVWVTASFPISLYAYNYPSNNLFSSGLDANGEAYLRRTMQVLDAANVAVYPVDIRGLVTLDMGGIEEDVTGRYLRQRFSSPAAPMLTPAQRRLEAMNSVADATGGLSFHNSNELADGIHRAIEDSSSYYLLGYYRTEKGGALESKPITVKVHHAGARIRTRSSVYVGKPAERTYTAELVNALYAPWDYTGLPISVRWTGPPSTGAQDKKLANFEIAVSPGSIALTGHHIQMQYAAAVKTLDGKMIERWSQATNGDVTADQERQIAASGIGHRGALSLPSGRYVVRFVVRDDASGQIGSVLAPLTVN